MVHPFAKYRSIQESIFNSITENMTQRRILADQICIKPFGKRLLVTIGSFTLEKSQFDRTDLISAVHNLISYMTLSPYNCMESINVLNFSAKISNALNFCKEGFLTGLTTSFYIRYPSIHHLHDSFHHNIVTVRHKYTARHFIVPVVAYSILFNLPKFFELTATCPEPMVTLT